MTTRVCILTFARKPEFAFGNLLVFKTIREGFPTADLEVWDNASCDEVARQVHAEAQRLDARFVGILSTARHADWIEARVRDAARDGVSLVIVDPDVAFWEKVEDWEFPRGTLMAGRYVPRMKVYGAIVEPRLHTSHLWFPDPKALVEKLDKLPPELYDFSPFRGALFAENGIPRHIDTCGALFSVLAPGEAFGFMEEHLDAYDHLWVGTSPDFMEERFEGPALELVRGSHEDAKRDYTTMRGLWRKQETLWDAVTVIVQKPVLPEEKHRPSEWELYLRWAKGNEDAARLMCDFGHATQLADDLVDADRANVSTLERRSETMTRLLFTCLVSIQSNRFFRQHEPHFRPLFISCLSLWDASNSWRHAEKVETRMFSYVTREACGRLHEMIAYLVGGLEWMRQVTREIHDQYHGRFGVEGFAAWDAETRALEA